MLSITQWAGTSRRCFWLAIGAALVLSSAVSVEAPEREKRIMPPGLEGVEIGMGRADLLMARPKAVPYRHWISEVNEILLGDWVKAQMPTAQFQEALATPAFAPDVVYTVDEKQGALVSVAIGGHREPAQAKQVRREFVRWCIDTWGRDCEERVRTTSGLGSVAYEQPLLMWRRGDIVITASWTPEFRFVFPDETWFGVNITRWQDDMKDSPTFGRPLADGEAFLPDLLKGSSD